MKIRTIVENYRAALPLIKKISTKRVLNLLRYLYESRTGKGISKAKPLILDIVPTKRCNLNCIFCVKYPTEGQMDMDLATFKNIAKQLFPYAFLVYFCSGGEHFLNKDMVEFLKICKKYNIAVGLVTNGSFLDEKLCRFLIKDTSLYNVGISFDGARKETVESIRRGVDYDKVVESMKTLARIKKQLKKKTPFLTIRCAVMKQNIEEIPELIEKAHEWGMDEVRLEYLVVVNKMSQEDSLFNKKKLAERYFKKAKKLASKYNIKLILPPKIKKEERNDPCYIPYRFAMIDTDGTVHFCYRSWNNPVGNIMEEKDFGKIWNNEKYVKLRKTVNSKKPYYRYCEICPAKKGAGYVSFHTDKTKNDYYYYSFKD